MQTYLDLLTLVLETGKKKPDRTGTGTIGVFGAQAKFDLRDGFPLLTTKKLHTKSIIHELLWMLRGETNIKSLNEVGVTIWDEWADQNGNLGPVYGAQWRYWGGSGLANQSLDQITAVVDRIKTNPFCRRLIVTAWNPADVKYQALPPCHCLFQFNCEPNPDGPDILNLQMYQRSCDLFLGVPFNIASYALLLQMVAHVTQKIPGVFTHTYGDLHLYLNHIDQVKEQLSREPRPLPKMEFTRTVTDLLDFKFEDFKLVGYDPHPPIKAEVSV